MYLVIGGVYTDTSFTKLEPESPVEEYGPFETYEEAYDKWRSATGWRVDTCCHRLFIEEVVRASVA